MTVEAFLDSNIPIYAASKDPKDAVKRDTAAKLMLETRFGISLQVAQEFYHNARIKARLAISSKKAERIIELLLSRPCVVSDAALFADARRLCERYQLQYWDAAIVAAARRQGAPLLYSEDLTHGQEFEGVLVINPFLEKA
jgi:predicted nucleic acid-binding protein